MNCRKSEITLQEFEEMFRLQGVLNTNTNGPDWAKTSLTKTDNIIDWYLCMSQETSEAINSIQWKHWKDCSVISQFTITDLNNLKTELTDIWHFLMSQVIVNDEVDYIINIAVNDSFEVLTKGKHVLSALKGFQVKVLTEQSNESIIEAFLQLLISVFEDPRELLRSYMKKNVLNQFRQDNGYKEGTYIKVWSGLEDNVYLDNYTGEYSYDAIYEYLNINYKQYAIVDTNKEGK